MTKENIDITTAKPTKPVKKRIREYRVASDILKKERLEYIIFLLTQGLQAPAIKKEIAKQIAKAKLEERKFIDFDLTERQIENYIHEGRELISKTCRDPEYYVGRSVRRYDDLYGKLYKLTDFKGAASVNEKLENLLGLSKKELRVTGELDIRTEITVELPKRETTKD